MGASTPRSMHGTHAAAEVAPTVTEYALPALTVVQFTHALSACAPSFAENVPAAQGVHAVAPAEGAQKPATHAVHAPLPGMGA